MKQVTHHYKSGRIGTVEVPKPQLKPGGVLVRSAYSVVSVGTEGMKVREGQLSTLEKAKARPDLVKKVIRSVQQQGLLTAYQKVMHKIDTLTPLGYSVAGVITAVGEGAEEFQVGQSVACAGAGYANHAEINFVPKHLVAPIPEGVALEHAAFTTLGAIAMHGVRQAQVQLGESACVIGLGLIGQLVVQLLHAAGVTVIGIDLNEERCELAKQNGAVSAFPPQAQARARVEQQTQGMGADHLFLTAGTSNSAPIQLAVELARDRARIVDIGKTSVEFPWNDSAAKELQFTFSRSYGPGRYDPSYEEHGVDYPHSYVRWTENRNMRSFLQLVASCQVNLTSILSDVIPFSETHTVYQQIAEGRYRGVGLVFQYPEPSPSSPAPPSRPTIEDHRLSFVSIHLGCIGAGNYVSGVLLPHLQNQEAVHWEMIATSQGLSAANAQQKFGFREATTASTEVFQHPTINTVLIGTPHSSHASLVVQALQAGKAVFVEKPLAIDLKGLEQVREALAHAPQPQLMVGFNRRFSPALTQLSQWFQHDAGPLMMNYRVYAGSLEGTSWHSDPSEGGRFVGEAGHFFDVFAYLTQSRPVSVSATRITPLHPTTDELNNVSVTVRYSNGSVGNLTYLTQGGATTPKEFLEVFGAGITAQMHNFESLVRFDGRRKDKVRLFNTGKGQKEEMTAWIQQLQSDRPALISIDSLLDTTLLTLAVVDALKHQAPVTLAKYWQT